MKTETFHLELITPCFCGGAEPERQAEIRAASIRGQLRWWFRTLGGFKSLVPVPVPKQEAMIFGSTAGDEGRAGKLIVRVSAPPEMALTDSAEFPSPKMDQPEGYLLFPLRQQVRKKSALPSFIVSAQWRGEAAWWDDIRALIAVFGHLGALGFRSRRAMGALAFKNVTLDLVTATARFARPTNILIKEIQATGPMPKAQCIPTFAKWLRGWRQHGQMNRRWDGHTRAWIDVPSAQKGLNRAQRGFPFARRDHNEGLDVQGTGAPNPDPENPAGQPGQTFRPALGLPIIQYFSSLGTPNGLRGRATVNWELEWNQERQKAEGRFASPILLRPHRDADGEWHALVIFVDAHKWPGNHRVSLVVQGRPKERAVSLDLYEAMKKDAALKPFP